MEKMALYFEAGTREAWICDQDGEIAFHHRAQPGAQERSEICPSFPAHIEL
jgi:Uma2 family endonuclease